MYPVPRTVLIIVGRCGSSSSLRRRRPTWTSIVRSKGPASRLRARSSSRSRVNTWLALLTNAARRSNSPVVSRTSFPDGEYSSRLDKSRFQPANLRLRAGRDRVLFDGAARGPAQHALHPGQQLAQVERFRQVVVRAHLQADDAVDDFAAPGQDDDTDAGFLAQRSSQGQPVLSGQHQIEDYEVDRRLRHDLAHPGAVLRRRDPVTLAGKILLDEIADLALIVDNQDVTVVIHAGQLRLPLIAVRPDRELWCRPGAPSRASIHIVTKSYRKRVPVTSSDYASILNSVAFRSVAWLMIGNERSGCA